MNTQKNASTFKFSNPNLVSSILLINKNYKGNLSKVKTLTFELEAQETPKEDQKDSYQESTVILTVRTSNDIKMDDKTPCYILVTMEAKFFWKKGVYTKGQERKLLKINAPSLLLSYIRPYIAELTEASELPVQHIPFIDFTKTIDEDD